METKKRTRKPKPELPTAKLISALKFIAGAQKRKGEVFERYCMMTNNWLVASNEILTIATPIEEDLQACPQTHALLDVLSKIKDKFALTRVSDESMAVAFGDAYVQVPCIPNPEVLNIGSPDEPTLYLPGELDLRQGLGNLLPILNAASDKKDKQQSVLFKENVFAVVTKRAIVEYWHRMTGIEHELHIPKEAIAIISKAKHRVAKIGYSISSITFWFEDESFVQTRTYDKHFGNYESNLKTEGLDFIEVPQEFYDAVRTLSGAIDDDLIVINCDRLTTTDEDETYIEIGGIDVNMVFYVSYLLAIENVLKFAHFDEANFRVIGGNENMRCVICSVKVE